MARAPLIPSTAIDMYQHKFQIREPPPLDALELDVSAPALEDEDEAAPFDLSLVGDDRAGVGVGFIPSSLFVRLDLRTSCFIFSLLSFWAL